jgi:uncharacterized Fe-S cluster-containing MiaB family protein
LEAAFEAEREAIARANRGPASKLYNASNFFDHRAVPPGDDPLIAQLLAPFVRVTVECHARLVGPRCLEFAERMDGRLEVALGLETVHPEALPALNKGMTLDDFRQAAGTLRGAGIGVRVASSRWLAHRAFRWTRPWSGPHARRSSRSNRERTE